MSSVTTKTTAEVVPLAERLRYTQIFRLAVVAGVVFALVRSPGLATVDTALLLATTGGYLLLTLVGYGLWKALAGQALTLFGGLLIVDGLYLAWLSQATGGSASPLRYLILLHLVAVALLASYRTGLKLAMWHSLLLWVGYQLQESGQLPVADATRALPGSELDRLLLFAAMVWIATLATASFSAVNERELRRRRYDSDALAAMAERLEAAHEPLEVTEVLMTSVVDAFDFARGVVLVAPEGDPDAVLLMAKHGEVDTAAAADPLPDGSPVRRVLQTRETLLVGSLTAAEAPWLAALLPDAGNLVLVPLSAEGRSMGVLIVEHSLRAGSRIERRVVSAVERFASHASLALRNAWLLQQLREMADTDGLTGIANRRTFDEALERELSRAARSGEEVSLVLLDIDHFKRLNDDHGHQVGDDVLRRVARAIAGATRRYDLAARYGGEEFAVILPRTPREDAAMVAERLRRHGVDAPGDPGCTVSAGVATYPHDAADPAALIVRADEALYASKHAGRDRLTVAGEQQDLVTA